MIFFTKSFKFPPQFFVCILAGFMLLACESIESGKSASANRSDSGFSGTEQEDIAGDLSDAGKNSGQQSRGLDMANARVASGSFEEEFPLLYGLIKDDSGQLLPELKAYAEKVLSQDINSEAEILALMEQRDSSLITFITPLFENMDPEILDKSWGGFQEELNRLGMTMTAAEGMFTSIGSAPFLEDKIAEVGSKEFQAYVKFMNALTESRNGEYPFQNMKPFRDMVLYGEIILEGNNEAFKKRIDEDFQFALESFTDVHFVSSPGTRQLGVAMVHGTSTDPYPYLAELETAKEFVASGQDSKYKKALSRILEKPSAITEKPENIYVVVIEWAETKQMAQMRVRSHLRVGEDVPHHLKIRRGDGTDKYAVTYRFYEDEEKANAAFDEAIKEFPDARLIYCSVRNGDLYQLGI
ncbi:MAG: hypothetical protein AAFR87_31210 [Bacteroidota bacterium]